MLRSFISAILILIILSGIGSQIVVAQQGQSYESNMQSGNERFQAGDFISAKTYFEMALRIRENDATAQKRLSETITRISQQMEQQERFYQHLDYGDRLLSEGKLQEALSAYQQALLIFPEDKYTKAQANKIRDEIAQTEAKESAYVHAMNIGQQLLEAKKYEEALLQFDQALQLFPDRTEAKNSHTETKALLEEQQAIEHAFHQLKEEAQVWIARKNYEAAIQKLEEALQQFPDDAPTRIQLAETRQLHQKTLQYEELLASADQAYENKQMQQARQLYTQALDFWPDQAYPTDMISRIDAYFESDSYLSTIALAQYLEEAERLYQDQAWKKALELYHKVLDIEPEHIAATERVTEISFQLKQVEELAQQEDAFQQLVKQGDDYSEQHALTEAAHSYREALKIFDREAIQTKLSQTEELLAQQKQMVQQQEQYDQLIQQADDQIVQKEWTQSKLLLEAAIAILPDREEAKTRMERVSTELQRIESEILAVETQYEQLMQHGIQALEDEHYDVAYQAFDQAQQLKPSESLPKEKIKEIGAIQTQKAAALELEKRYHDLIAQADQLFESKRWEEALETFTEAQKIMPEENYPIEKIAAIGLIIQEADTKKKIEQEYALLISQGDEALHNQQLGAAKEKYTAALVLQPDEAYPKEQNRIIDDLIARQAEKEEQEAAYQEHIAQADQLMQLKEWEQAMQRFESAAVLKPEESYPKQKIEEIKILIGEQAAAEALAQQIEQLINQMEEQYESGAYDEANTTANEILKLDAQNSTAVERKQQIKSAMDELVRQTEQSYQNAIQQGDVLVEEKSYQDAIIAYKTALGYKKDDAVAKERILQVEKIQEERLIAIRSAYNQELSQADRHYRSGNYDLAIEFYLKAEGIKPDESYPREMIGKIADAMEANKIRELLSTALRIESNQSEKFDFEPVDVAERRSNYILIKAKNLTENTFTLLVNFGSPSGRNGGFVLPIPDNALTNDFIVRIGSQYKWFSEDNTWIELLPENGQIELYQIQISKGAL
ncbi:MAG: hypothetical protein M0Q41_08970 [Bacteroidales bacterium]|nr:hypothetical protein [Bacteroidales bacterium]